MGDVVSFEARLLRDSIIRAVLKAHDGELGHTEIIDILFWGIKTAVADIGRQPVRTEGSDE